jgi:hypothetical protein
MTITPASQLRLIAVPAAAKQAENLVQETVMPALIKAANSGQRDVNIWVDATPQMMRYARLTLKDAGYDVTITGQTTIGGYMRVQWG